MTHAGGGVPRSCLSPYEGRVCPGSPLVSPQTYRAERKTSEMRFTHGLVFFLKREGNKKKVPTLQTQLWWSWNKRSPSRRLVGAMTPVHPSVACLMTFSRCGAEARFRGTRVCLRVLRGTPRCYPRRRLYDTSPPGRCPAPTQTCGSVKDAQSASPYVSSLRRRHRFASAVLMRLLRFFLPIYDGLQVKREHFLDLNKIKAPTATATLRRKEKMSLLLFDDFSNCKKRSKNRSLINGKSLCDINSIQLYL